MTLMIHPLAAERLTEIRGHLGSVIAAMEELTGTITLAATAFAKFSRPLERPPVTGSHGPSRPAWCSPYGPAHRNR